MAPYILRHTGRTKGIARVRQKKKTQPYSSPVCFMHELDGLPRNWNEIKAWRTAQRKEQIARRLGCAPDERRSWRDSILDQLGALVDVAAYPVLGIYWPIRGEIDIRELARRQIAAGGRIALPVVVMKASPVEFWAWTPGTRMRRGLCNIPVPRDPEVLVPGALIVPMVAFDRTHFRLGYGGGYYDRTLAVAAPRPRTIGIAFASAELTTIYPQAHDIAMDAIVTEQSTFGDMLHRNQERPATT